jgi:uncharacterized membrane protein
MYHFYRIAFLIIVCAGLIVLQVFLARKEQKWAGLILLVTAFCISIVPVADGILARRAFSDVSAVFLTVNIMTVILLVIYILFSDKRRKKRALDKMKAQDLG